MPSTLFISPSRAACALALLPLLANVVTATDLSAMTYSGCYSSSAPLTDQGSYTWQTSGYCQPICVKLGKAVLGLSNGSDCWCGDELPASDSKVDDSNCSTGCDGFDTEMCGGGTTYLSVYLSGTSDDVSNYGGDSSSSASSSSSTPTPTATTAAPTTSAATITSAATQSSQIVTSVLPGTTIIVTQAAAAAATSSGTSDDSPTKDSSSKSSGPNVAGIAAGVVVAVVALAAIIAGALLFMRRRKRQEMEEEHKRKQVSEFMNAGGERKPPNTGYSQMSDSRLDPEAAAGRNSVGSIADDQDYSRRILRVANPDDSGH